MKKGFVSLIFFAFLSVYIYGCGSSGSKEYLPSPYQPSVPFVSVEPPSGSVIQPDQKITLSFSEEMVTKDVGVSLSSTITAAEVQSFSWSNLPYLIDNSTLIVNPVSWLEGKDRLLILENIKSKEGQFFTSVYGVGSIGMVYTIDGTSPSTYAITPTNNTTISKNSVIRIIFTETMDMDATSILTTGSIGNYYVSWSRIFRDNDTIYLIPKSNWTEGTGSVTLNSFDLAGNQLTEIVLDYTVDSNVPSYDVSPANGTALGTDDSVKVVFSESMLTNSLSVSGSLSASGYLASWSSTLAADDTVTITPTAGSFDFGEGNLEINIFDLYGNEISPIYLTYDVAGSVLHVSKSGDDANNGSVTSPLLTINAALTLASSLTKPVVVNVSTGTYLESTISMSEDVSLFGGFNWDFSIRNSASYISEINSTCVSGTCITISFTAGEFSETTIDGFTINGGSGGASKAILIVDSTPTVTNNIINGGSGGAQSIGVYVFTNGEFNLKDNVIEGGSSLNFSRAVHLFIASGGGGMGGYSDYNIEFNKINGGLSPTSVGIEAEVLVVANAGIDETATMNLTLENNFIDGGSGTTGSKAVDLVETLISTSGTAYGWGTADINHNTITSLDEVIENDNFTVNILNNILFDGVTCLSNISGTMEAKNNNIYNCTVDTSGTVTLSGNVDVDPVFVSTTDLHLTSSTPVSVTEGGLSTDCALLDYDRDIRGTLCSMGADEY